MRNRSPSKTLFDAIEFAAQAHAQARQCRKGTNIPYIVHPLGVAKTLIEYGCPEAVVIAALLHDTVEDTRVAIEEIERRFGRKVARLVTGASEPDKSDTWENRKRHTINYLATAPVDVVLIAVADKLDNIRAIREDYEKLGEKVWSRFNRPKADQQWYFRSLAKVFHKRLKGRPAAALSNRFKSEVQKVFGKDARKAK